MRLTLLTTCLFGFFVFVCPKSIDTNIQVRFNLPHISIINGIPALAGDFPFMASLVLPLNASVARFCGGTLIASSYVLTAAHCVFG
ncbi:mite allergen Der p 3-like [Daphnia pulicaria]|uniref:mite allergen Der p 3-like n=1 Tax=Daphnia pulicaria TaxID=35523 RepID=UPI001EEC9F8D|nr:mite allergen Der p 3-like [Daphnia pulicaria]